MSLSIGWFKTPAEEEMEVKGYSTVARQPAAPGYGHSEKKVSLHNSQNNTFSLPDFSPSSKFKGPLQHSVNILSGQ